MTKEELQAERTSLLSEAKSLLQKFNARYDRLINWNYALLALIIFINGIISICLMVSPNNQDLIKFCGIVAGVITIVSTILTLFKLADKASLAKTISNDYDFIINKFERNALEFKDLSMKDSNSLFKDLFVTIKDKFNRGEEKILSESLKYAMENINHKTNQV